MARKAKRRLGNGIIKLISLVPRGANGVVSLFKSRGMQELQGVAKLDADGYLTSLVYVPDTVDSDGDTANAEVIKQWCHDFIANMEGSGIDVMHDCKPVGVDRAQLCETFIVQKGDPRFIGIHDIDGEPIDPTGAWGTVMKIHDPVLKAPYKEGDWVGVSMFGSVLTEPLSKQLPNPNQEDMNEETMKALLKSFGGDLATQIVEGLSKALKPVEKTEPAKPVVKFDGDPTNADDIAKHKDALFLAGCDLSTLEGIAKWEQYLAKAKAAAPAENVDELKKQVDALQARIDKAAKASNAPAGDDVRKGAPKTIQEKLAAGQARAAELKKQRIL